VACIRFRIPSVPERNAKQQRARIEWNFAFLVEFLDRKQLQFFLRLRNEMPELNGWFSGLCIFPQ
jgi:hypothetical protein